MRYQEQLEEMSDMNRTAQTRVQCLIRVKIYLSIDEISRTTRKNVRHEQNTQTRDQCLIRVTFYLCIGIEQSG